MQESLLPPLMKYAWLCTSGADDVSSTRCVVPPVITAGVRVGGDAPLSNKKRVSVYEVKTDESFDCRVFDLSTPVVLSAPLYTVRVIVAVVAEPLLIVKLPPSRLIVLVAVIVQLDLWTLSIWVCAPVIGVYNRAFVCASAGEAPARHIRATAAAERLTLESANWHKRDRRD